MATILDSTVDLKSGVPNTLYTFDLQGNVVSKTSSNANTWYTYDDKGNVIKEEMEISGSKYETNSDYDGNGNLIGVTVNGTAFTMNWMIENDAAGLARNGYSTYYTPGEGISNYEWTNFLILNIKMNSKIILILVFSVVILSAQDFLPQYKKHEPVFRNYIKKNKIVQEKANYYSTSKDYIPTGKPFLSEVFTYRIDGKLESAKIISDSTSTVIDSFLYNKAGSFSEIKRFTKIALTGRDSVKFESYFFYHDSTGKITHISWFEDRLRDTLPRLSYHYTYGKNGKLEKIICPVVFGPTTIDTLVYEYDKSERLLKEVIK
ncbi:MAG: hypothetical protein IPJ75_11595 [Ignavibacteriales bacterium]|nr:hypothetical protein [Ignavibacteriales bacterium]